MTTPDLFNRYISDVKYQQHSAASRRAAIGYEPRQEIDKGKILHHIKQCGKYGVTDNELIEHFVKKMSPNTPRARRVELWEDGHVVMTWRERKNCAVWVYYPYATEGDEQLSTTVLIEKEMQ